MNPIKSPVRSFITRRPSSSNEVREAKTPSVGGRDKVTLTESPLLTTPLPVERREAGAEVKAAPPAAPGRDLSAPLTVLQHPFLEPAVSSQPSTPTNSPSLASLREKLFAVHATDTLPARGVFKAGAQHIDREKRGKEPASFRPTIHFSLGEMVRPHGRSSWEEKPYAVVLPLKELESQLVNVAPHDTFIVGDFKIPPGATFLVPEGTKLEGFPEQVRVKTYTGSLREAVDRTIQEGDGWSVRMEGVSTDDPARLDDKNINTPEFFSSLLQARPDISFGSHINSEVGEAFRFGQIEQSLVQLTRQYDSSYGLSNQETQFYRALIDHSLQGLKVPDHPEAQKSVNEKKQHISSYLKTIDTDLKLRRTGLTLAGAGSEVQKKAVELACSGSPLGPALSSQLRKAQDSPVSIGALTEALHPLPPEELQDFVRNNPSVFKGVDQGVFQARYALKRWLEQRQDKEGLESLLYEGLQKAGKPAELLKEMEGFLDPDSYRSDLSLTIMRRPVVQQNLRKEEGMQFSPGGPTTLLDAIKSHPKAKLGLGEWTPKVPVGEEEAVSLLKDLGELRPQEAPAVLSFKACSGAATHRQWAQDSVDKALEQIRKPLKSVRKEKDIMAGDRLSLYELLRRDGSASLKLPDDMWTRPESLLEFYQGEKNGTPLKKANWLSSFFGS